MRGYRWIAGLVAGLLLAAPVLADAGPSTKSGGQDKVQIKPVTVTRQGGAYCFDRPIVYGNVAIAGGRCYNFYVLRTSGGAFLGFGPPGPPMRPSAIQPIVPVSESAARIGCRPCSIACSGLDRS